MLGPMDGVVSIKNEILMGHLANFSATEDNSEDWAGLRIFQYTQYILETFNCDTYLVYSNPAQTQLH
jgi:hypothetical protein